MAKHAHAQTGADREGNVLFRMRCDACNRHGVWLSKLEDVERSCTLHDRSQHAERSAA